MCTLPCMCSYASMQPAATTPRTRAKCPTIRCVQQLRRMAFERVLRLRITLWTWILSIIVVRRHISSGSCAFTTGLICVPGPALNQYIYIYGFSLQLIQFYAEVKVQQITSRPQLQFIRELLLYTQSTAPPAIDFSAKQKHEKKETNNLEAEQVKQVIFRRHSWRSHSPWWQFNERLYHFDLTDIIHTTMRVIDHLRHVPYWFAVVPLSLPWNKMP